MSDKQFQNELEMKSGVPDSCDWDSARRMMKFLEQFYQFTLKVSGSKYITSNLFLPEVGNLYNLLRNWVIPDKKDYQLSFMATKMKQKYDKYWGDVDKMNKLLYIAAVLDPRLKLQFIGFTLKWMYNDEKAVSELTKDIELATYELYAHYENQMEVGEDSSSQTELDDNGGNVDLVAEYMKQMQKERGVVNNTELDRYLKEGVEKSMDAKFNVLGWWKVNSHRFPTLSRMARDVLAVPVSTVSSETAFSTGGRVLNDFRSSLTPRIVEALICTQDWLRAYSSACLVEEDSEEIDNIDEELSMIMNAIGISDVPLPRIHTPRMSPNVEASTNI
ncbi:unnamed protein product [Linum trigynum]|uniref:Zinc finger BED domain-containing protein RICESLEEPER 2-like n=1 Tax=Linum trigynum TaxID=586398 RepID=A0AAV2GP82_9ROSI